MRKGLETNSKTLYAFISSLNLHFSVQTFLDCICSLMEKKMAIAGSAKAKNSVKFSKGKCNVFPYTWGKTTHRLGADLL